MEPPPHSTTEQQELIHDLFHALNQPLTALRCSLELALLQPNKNQHHEQIRAALDYAVEITRLTTGLRELLQAQDAVDQLQALPLELYLVEAVEHFHPAAEMTGIQLELSLGPTMQVWFEPWRLRQALFRLMEFLLDGMEAGGKIEIRGTEPNAHASLLYVRASGCILSLPSAEENPQRRRSLDRRLHLAIVRSLLEAAGGNLQIEQLLMKPHQTIVQLTLHLPVPFRIE